MNSFNTINLTHNLVEASIPHIIQVDKMGQCVVLVKCLDTDDGMVKILSDDMAIWGYVNQWERVTTFGQHSIFDAIEAVTQDDANEHTQARKMALVAFEVEELTADTWTNENIWLEGIENAKNGHNVHCAMLATRLSVMFFEEFKKLQIESDKQAEKLLSNMLS